MQSDDDLLARIEAQAGGLLEICVLGTTLADWRKVIAFARESAAILSETVSGAPATINLSEESFTDGEALSIRLALAIGGQVWTTDFYSEDLIDFQGEPAEVNSSEALDAVRRFMADLHDITGKPVILIPESVKPTDVTPYLEVR